MNRSLVEQQRILANPAESRRLGQRLFENGCAVSEDPGAVMVYAMVEQIVVDAFPEFDQPAANHFVVITAEGITRDISVCGGFELCQRFGPGR